jgi:hypothetical protein
MTGVVPFEFVGFENVTAKEKLLISPAGTLAVVGLNVSAVTCSVPPLPPPQPVTLMTLATASNASAQAEILFCIYQTPLIWFEADFAIVSLLAEKLRASIRVTNAPVRLYSRPKIKKFHCLSNLPE